MNMLPIYYRISLTVLAAFGIALCDAGGIEAAPVSISPITVFLPPTARVATLTVRNPSDGPLRVQASGFTWRQTEAGQIKTDSTKDLIIYPELATIPAFGVQQIRVAVTQPPSDQEHTYRVVLELLPPQEQTNPGGSGNPKISGQLHIRTDFSVPIYQEPADARPSGRVTISALRSGLVSFTVANLGNTHLYGDPLKLTAKDASGKVVFSQDVPGWVTLAGNTRSFTAQIPRATCKTVRSLSIVGPKDAHLSDGKLDVSASDCQA